MLAYLNEMERAGVSSFKIEGRMKSGYYLATVINAYRRAMDGGDVSVSEKELLAVVKEVMSREDLKYCPHGRPICITLSKKMLEKQFKRS